MKNSLIYFLQTWGILLVVSGHSETEAPQSTLLHMWIYSFHMPLFMFISGYLLRYGCDVRRQTFVQTIYNRKFLIKKVKRLLVPYFIISTLAFVPKVLMSQFAIRPTTFSFKEYFSMLIYPWENVIMFFWFLPTLFLIFCILHIGGRILQKWNIPLWGCLPVALALHLFNPVLEIKIFNISGVVNYLFYFLFGYFVCRYHSFDFITHHPAIVFSSTFALSAALLTLPDFQGRDVLTAMNGIMMSYALGRLYFRYNCTILHHLFGASYTIYLYSWFPQVLAQQVFCALTGAPWWIGGILAFFTGVYIPLLIYRWIMKYRETRIGKAMAFISGIA